MLIVVSNIIVLPALTEIAFALSSTGNTKRAVSKLYSLVSKVSTTKTTLPVGNSLEPVVGTLFFFVLPDESEKIKFIVLLEDCLYVNGKMFFFAVKFKTAYKINPIKAAEKSRALIAAHHRYIRFKKVFAAAPLSKY